mgnify:CR=1 FL=1
MSANYRLSRKTGRNQLFRWPPAKSLARDLSHMILCFFLSGFFFFLFFLCPICVRSWQTFSIAGSFSTFLYSCLEGCVLCTLKRQMERDVGDESMFQWKMSYVKMVFTVAFGKFFYQ